MPSTLGVQSLQRMTLKETKEDPKRLERDLAHIKDWLKKQPHLKTARRDDQWLLAFLRGCKFSLEKTKEKLDTYYTMRTLLPEFFSNRDPMLPEIQEVLRWGCVGVYNLYALFFFILTFSETILMHLPLPKKDAHGRLVTLVRMAQSDPSIGHLRTVIKATFMILDILLLEDEDMLKNGDVHFVDNAGLTVAHVLQATPSLIKKTLTCFQEGYPNRPKEIHYFNLAPVYNSVIALVLQFMKKKLQKRLNGYPDLPSLQEKLPVTLLPDEYGGEVDNIEQLTDYWKKKVESYRDWFLEDEMRKSDEKQRPGQPKTEGTTFGIEGSFRQLDVD